MILAMNIPLKDLNSTHWKKKLKMAIVLSGIKAIVGMKISAEIFIKKSQPVIMIETAEE